MGFEVFIIRAPKDLVNTVLFCDVLQKVPSDKRGQFLSVAQIHVINQKSCDDLANIMKQKYADDEDMLAQINDDLRIFRVNIVIDVDGPYAEDRMYELRIDHVLFRQVGLTGRCKNITI